jgi:tetratricopeptide (TPR) repeat protein
MRIYFAAGLAAFLLSAPQVLAAEPSDDTVEALGQCLGGQLEAQPTVDICTRVLADPAVEPLDRVLALLPRAYAYLDLGMAEQALADANEVVSIDASGPDGYHLRGIAYADLGHNDEALADQSKTIALAQDYQDAYVERGYLLLDKQDFAGAERDFGQAVALGDMDVSASLGHATALLGQNKNSDAATEYTEVLTKVGNNPFALYGRGVAYVRMGQTEMGQSDIAAANAADMTTADVFASVGIMP